MTELFLALFLALFSALFLELFFGALFKVLFFALFGGKTLFFLVSLRSLTRLHPQSAACQQGRPDLVRSRDGFLKALLGRGILER